MTAVKENNLAKVRHILTSTRVNLEEPDDQGFTPLIWAAREGDGKTAQGLAKGKGHTL